MRLLVTLALIASCSRGDERLEHVFDACAPLQLLIPDGATSAELASIDRGLRLWNEAAATLLSREPVAGSAVLPLRWMRTPLALYGQYEDETPDILLNRAIDDDAERAFTVAHELGHAFGLFHVERAERRSVMNPNNLSEPPTPADVDALADLWGRCP